MATLDAHTAHTWKQRLDACHQPWIIATVHSENYGKEQPPRGLLGILDWRLRGGLSRLLHNEHLKPGSFSILANRGSLGKAKLLLYWYSSKEGLTPLLSCLQQLKAQEVCLAEATFPEDFSEKLKHNLKKEGVRWASLDMKKI